MSAVREDYRVSADKLAEYLGTRRWFGGKGRAITDATLGDVIPIQWPTSSAEFAVARARVTTHEEGAAHYQLFLERAGALGDALENEDFRRGLANAFQQGASFARNGTRWIVASEGKKPIVVPARAAVTLSTSEQTNSSIFINSDAILKLYRKLEPGVHPDVEVTRFLTIERGFAHVPVLLGTIRFEDRAGVTIAGMLQELVPGAVDGWTYALECSAKYIAGTERHQASHPFEDDANQLGVVTRLLHEALSSGDAGSGFELDPATPDETVRWARGAKQTIEKALASLERAIADKAFPTEQRAEAKALVGRRPRFLAWLSELATGIASDAGANTRTHGDYHLGQVLRSAAGRFLIIDFEGEPARPLSERRARQSPLRDVAGMLRSFAYAAATVAQSMKRGDPTGDARSARWERGARDAFLRGYFSATQSNTSLLPRSRNNAGRLIALFEAEKVFYELQYELDHRPDWVWIPLRGIAKLYT